MKVVILTSDQPRHRFLCSEVAKSHEVLGVICEKKGSYYGHQKAMSPLVAKHFQVLNEYENKYFGDCSLGGGNVATLERSEINNSRIIDGVIEQQPDLLILFGTGILGGGWITAFDQRIVNIHLGFSPYYRGSATLFWPFVNNELDKVGATVHLAASKVDAGDVLSVIKAEVSENDNYYDITNKTIRSALEQVAGISECYLNNGLVAQKQDMSLGKVYKKKDFNETALRAALINGKVSWIEEF